MSQTRDERFQELALKLVSFECPPAEKAELRRLLEEKPARREQLQQLCLSVGVAREVLPLADALEATEGRLSVSELETFKSALAQRREKQTAPSLPPPVIAPAAAKPRLLSVKELEILVLRVLSERPMDGFSLAQSLQKAQVSALAGGEGTIYGLLIRLESSGCVQGRWRPDGGRMAKSYFVTEKGTTLLRGHKATFAHLEEVSRHILAADASGL